MALEDFVREFDAAPFELINDEKRLLVPALPQHGEVVIILMRLLFQLEQSAGIVFYTEQPFVLLEASDWVKGSRVPDIMVYTALRMNAYKAATPDWERKPFALIPDLCIEIVSKNDDFDEVMEKVETYLEDGVRLVWVFAPQTRLVYVRSAGSRQATVLRADDELEGGDVIPGFWARVGAFF